MPSIAFTSSVATSTGDIALEICITHVLLVGAPSMCVHPVKCSALDKIDITLDPAFTISFAGVANSITVPELDVIKSIPFARLLDSLNRQARELGFLRIYTERASSNILFDIGQSTLPQVRESVCLERLDLRCTFTFSNTDLSPFSPSSPFSSFEDIYDEALKRVLMDHMIKQYPRVFHAAGIHEDVIPDLIARAITRISDRAVESFKNQNSLSVKYMRRELKKRHRQQSDAIKRLLGNLPLDDDAADFSLHAPSRDMHSIIACSLRAVFRDMRPISALKPASKTDCDGNSELTHILSEGSANQFAEAIDSQHSLDDSAIDIPSDDHILPTVELNDDQNFMEDVYGSSAPPSSDDMLFLFADDKDLLTLANCDEEDWLNFSSSDPFSDLFDDLKSKPSSDVSLIPSSSPQLPPSSLSFEDEIDFDDEDGLPVIGDPMLVYLLDEDQQVMQLPLSD